MKERFIINRQPFQYGKRAFLTRFLLAYFPVLLVFSLILSCAGRQPSGSSSSYSTELVPIWYYQLPQVKDATFTIGEAPFRMMDNSDSLEAVEVAAFRLAVSRLAMVEYGLAEITGSVNAFTVDYVQIEPDRTTLAAVEQELIVLDSFVSNGVLHLLVVVSDNPEAKVSRWKWKRSTRRIPAANYTTQPNWISNPPESGEGIWYGVGIARHTQPLGWEIAERYARADIAAQLQNRVVVGQLDYFNDHISYTVTRHKETSSLIITSTKLIARWKDKEGHLYCLVRKDQ